MFSLFRKVINLLRRISRGLKEATYRCSSSLGLKLVPSHFTEEDKEHYKKWITPYLDDLSKICKNDSVKRYFTLKKEENKIKEPSETYQGPDSAYFETQSQKLLYSQIKEIIRLIIEYSKIIEIKGYLAKHFSAKRTKMTPEKMVLSFIADVLKEMIDYHNQPDDYTRLEKLIEYISKLLCLDSIKKNIRFRELLANIKLQLVAAKEKMNTVVRYSKSQTILRVLTNLSTNTCGDLLKYIEDLFSFESGVLTSSVIVANGSSWFRETDKLISDQKLVLSIENKASVANYISRIKKLEELEELEQVGPVGFCPAVQFEEAKTIVRNLQRLIIQLLIISKILEYFQREKSDILNQKYFFSLSSIKLFFIAIGGYITRLKANLIDMANWKDQYTVFMESMVCTDELCKKILALQASVIVCLKNISQIELEAEKFELLIAEKDEEKFDEFNDPSSNANIQALLELLNGSSSLVGKSEIIISESITRFLNSFRINNIFPKFLTKILEKMVFITVDSFDGLETIRSIKETEHAVTNYYEFLLRFFIKLITQPCSDEEMVYKQEVIEKVKNFIVINFAINSYENIKVLFNIIADLAVRVESLEDKNKRLNQIILTHLETFKATVLELISSNSSFIAEDSELDTIISENLRSGNLKLLGMPEGYLSVREITVELASQSETTGTKTRVLDSKFINTLVIFIKKLLSIIDRQNKYLKVLNGYFLLDRSSFILSFSNLSVLKELETLQVLSTKTNKILLSFIKLTASMTLSSISLEEDSRDIAIEDGEIKIVADHEGSKIISGLLPELEQAKKTLDEGKELIEARISGLRESTLISYEFVIKTIKSTSVEFLQVFSGFSTLQLTWYNMLSRAKNINMVFEYLAIKYIYELIDEILNKPESFGSNWQKLYIFIKLFENAEQDVGQMKFSKQFKSIIMFFCQQIDDNKLDISIGPKLDSRSVLKFEDLVPSAPKLVTLKASDLVEAAENFKKTADRMCILK